MSASLKGIQVATPKIGSKKEAVSNSFFTAAPSMSAHVTKAQMSGVSNVGFQASSFLSSALANAGH